MSYRGAVGAVVESGRGNGEISSFEWRIPNFLSLTGKRGDWYESPAFSGIWCFRIYPKGLWQTPSSDTVSLILFRLNSALPQTLDITLGIKGAEGVENKRGRIQEFLKDDRACFWFEFCSRPEVIEQRLMAGNVLIFNLDIKSVVPSIARGYIEASIQTDEDCKKTEENQSSKKRGYIKAFNKTDEDCKKSKVPSEENQSSKKRGVEELVQSLHRLWESKKECDVIIKVQDKEFPAHRLFLQARSAVFEAMFSHDMVEKQSGVVNMEDCNPETFPDFLEHVYTGSFEMISPSNVFSLYACSDKYDLGALKQECSEFIKRNMAVASFCEAITLAIKHNDRALIECATEFFCNNSFHIVNTAEWQIFLSQNSTVGNELFIKLLAKHKDIFVPGS